jgi:hypothetical protein
MTIATGRLNNNNALCLLNDNQGICSEDNVLFYLTDSEQRNPAEVLASLVQFNAVEGRGNPLQEVSNGAIAPLSFFADRLQPEPGLWFAD